MQIKGWEGILSERGKFVAAEDGFSYAAEQCGLQMIDTEAPAAAEFKEMLVEWFFSGNWLEVKEL